jgi:hypothetical protein
MAASNNEKSSLWLANKCFFGKIVYQIDLRYLPSFVKVKKN